jgi:LmbE family N-acetylglucosaminyl deacetylase
VAIKEFFEALKGRFQPDLILTHRTSDRHQDHRFVGEVTWQTFRDHLILEYEIPKYDGDLGTPNVYVEIPDWAATRKLEITAAHFPSQSSRSWFDPETFRSLLKLRAIECRATSGYAEGFEGRKLVL